MVRRGRPAKKPDVVLPMPTLGLIRDTLEIMLENMGMSEACLMDCMTMTKGVPRSQVDQLKHALRLAVDMGLMTYRDGRYMFTMENLENLLAHEHGDSDYEEPDLPELSTARLRLPVVSRATQSMRKKRSRTAPSAGPSTPPKRRHLHTLGRQSLRVSSPVTPVPSAASSRASMVGNVYTGFRDPRRAGGVAKRPGRKHELELDGVVKNRKREKRYSCAEQDDDVDTASVVSQTRTVDTEGEEPQQPSPKRTKSDTSVGSSHVSSGGANKRKSRGRPPAVKKSVVRQKNTAAILHDYLANSGSRILADSASSHTGSTADSEVGGPSRRQRSLKDEPSVSSVESKKSTLSKVSSKTSCSTEHSGGESKSKATTLMKPRGRKPKAEESVSSLGSSKSKATSCSTDDKDDGDADAAAKEEGTSQAVGSKSTSTVKSKRSTTSSAGKKSQRVTRTASKASSVRSTKSKKEAEPASTPAPQPADQADRRMQRSTTRFLGASSMVNVPDDDESETRSLHDFYS